MNVKDFFELAQLAEAGYASYEKFDTPKAALINREFSDTQAELFLANWAVVNGGYRPNTDSGYSSTLFHDKRDPGRYVLAFRGTEPTDLDDWRTDIGDIAVDGIAIDQIIDLYNEWPGVSRGAYKAAYLETLWTAMARCWLTPAWQYAIDGFVEWLAEKDIASWRSRAAPVLWKAVRAASQAGDDAAWRVAE